MEIKQIRKRNGRLEPFSRGKIYAAISKGFVAAGKKNVKPAYITAIVRDIVSRIDTTIPSVEMVQDIAEQVLMDVGEHSAAKRYILYRDEHAKIRAEQYIPDDVKVAFEQAEVYFGTPIQMFQFFSKYSKFNWDKGRRETWPETVSRAVDFLHELSEGKLDHEDYALIHEYMLEMKAMPSMRLLAMAGPAARRNNVTIYNCSFIAVDSITSFCEALYVSMSGCGVGYSVESIFVDELPTIKKQWWDAPNKYVIEDTTAGWYKALEYGLKAWFTGLHVDFDYSLIRPAGTILKTKGGRASGPAPFKKALDFIREKILNRQGKKLRPVDCHDIMCSIASAAISGGVRRSAMLCLFDFDDEQMMNCKSGDFWRTDSQRWNANNSAVVPSDITQSQFVDFFMKMVKSGRGEPGIFSRHAVMQTMPERRSKQDIIFGVNPCAETVLRSLGLCNLSIAIAREDDTFQSLYDKVRVATIIGTIQSMATNFPLLRDEWKSNCEEERLLGVDITGQMDSKIAQNPLALDTLKWHVIGINEEYAEKLGIRPSVSTTCVKPSGNSSVLFDCSPGVHARWAEYYIRRVRVSAHSPVFSVLQDSGVPMKPENGQTAESAITWVVSFPVKSPDGAIVKGDMGAIEQCEYWKMVKTNWAEHSVSCTITYKDDEILDVMQWVWSHRDIVSGLTFLPVSDAQYEQMPYEEITEQEYHRLEKAFPKIDFARLWIHEKEDYTKAAQELACMAGSCEI